MIKRKMVEKKVMPVRATREWIVKMRKPGRWRFRKYQSFWRKLNGAVRKVTKLKRELKEAAERQSKVDDDFQRRSGYREEKFQKAQKIYNTEVLRQRIHSYTLPIIKRIGMTGWLIWQVLKLLTRCPKYFYRWSSDKLSSLFAWALNMLGDFIMLTIINPLIIVQEFLNEMAVRRFTPLVLKYPEATAPLVWLVKGFRMTYWYVIEPALTISGGIVWYLAARLSTISVGLPARTYWKARRGWIHMPAWMIWYKQSIAIAFLVVVVLWPLCPDDNIVFTSARRLYAWSDVIQADKRTYYKFFKGTIRGNWRLYKRFRDVGPGNTFAWSCLSVILVLPPFLYFWQWNCCFWILELGGGEEDRSPYLLETDFELRWQTELEDVYSSVIFWAQQCTSIRFIYSYCYDVDVFRTIEFYWSQYLPKRIRYGDWFHPQGRDDIFDYWHDSVDEYGLFGENWPSYFDDNHPPKVQKNIFGPWDIVIFNRCWSSKAHLVRGEIDVQRDWTPHVYYFKNEWWDYISDPVCTITQDPVYGETEAFYTAAYLSEYYGACWDCYVNWENLAFYIRGRWKEWGKLDHYPLHYDWEYSPWASPHYKEYARFNGNKLPDNTLNNFFEKDRLYAWFLTWGNRWEYGVDPHLMADYYHPPLTEVIKSHSLYRRGCFKDGIPIDYTEYWPILSLFKNRINGEAWLNNYSWMKFTSIHWPAQVAYVKAPHTEVKQILREILAPDVMFFVWSLCKPEYRPGWYSARDEDGPHAGRSHVYDEKHRFALSPASAVHDFSGDLLVIYKDFL